MGVAPAEETFDLLVIGGGVNGVGVARDAAGRGLSVLLCEMDDLASHTSSNSSKLIHGGLRYLEHNDFKLVRHSLIERELLLRSAPHIIWPMRFVLPHHKALRPRWLIRLGLFLYDHLARRKLLPGSQGIDLGKHPAGIPLKSDYSRGFEYSDCWVEDARLVVLNAVDARERGAEVRTRTRCSALVRETGHWIATLVDVDGTETTVKSRSIVNAAGPWVEEVARMDQGSVSTHGVRLVKGSHIIVPARFDHGFAYIFQNSDERIIFALPFEGRYTLIGTTDVEISGDPGDVEISSEEILYLCQSASEYFEASIEPEDVVANYSGVRPLFDDAAENASKTTRDYVLHMDDNGPPIVSVFGGKLTTYRKLAVDVMEMLGGALSFDQSDWTAKAALPGGDIPGADFQAFLARCHDRWPDIDRAIVGRLARGYGTRIERVLGACTDVTSMGMHFGGGLYACEVRYLVEHEWATSAGDILERRTRLGLHVDQNVFEQLGNWLLNQRE